MDTEGRTIKEMLESGVVQLTVLEGTAAVQHNPQPVNIDGTITAPSIFVEKRDVEPKMAHCLVSVTDGKMVLVVNEQSVVDKFTITGLIEIGKKFKKIGINADVSYTPEKLAHKFRMLRSLFLNHSEHLRITSELRNMNAKVNQKIEASKDDRANMSLSFAQSVESSMPESFRLKLPLIEGEEPTEVEVNIILNANNGGITCTLESVEAEEFIDSAKEKLIKEEVDKIKDKVTVIFR